MKIVDVAEFYAEQGGGVRTYVNHKLKAAAAAGHEAVVIAPGPTDGEESRYGGRIIWIKSRPMPFDSRYYLLLNEKAVHSALDQERPDVIEGSSPWTGGWMAARYRTDALKSFIFHQDPVAVYPHTFLGRLFGYDRIDRLFKFYFRYLSKLSGYYDMTVTSGGWLADRLTQHGIQGATAVPFGVHKSRFGSADFDSRVRSELLAACGAPADARLLVTVSRHHPEKRLGTVLDGFAKAKQQQPLALVMFGDGPTRALVERKARAVGNVHVAGFSADPKLLAKALASADALVHGSAAETFGIVIAEALCAGLPIVVPNRGGAFELSDPSYAEAYEPGDANACADAIGRLLARNPLPTRAAARAAGRSKVLDKDQHFQALFAAYSKALTVAAPARTRLVPTAPQAPQVLPTQPVIG